MASWWATAEIPLQELAVSPLSLGGGSKGKAVSKLHSALQRLRLMDKTIEPPSCLSCATGALHREHLSSDADGLLHAWRLVSTSLPPSVFGRAATGAQAGALISPLLALVFDEAVNW